MNRQDIHDTPEERMVENILKVFRSASPAERHTGAVWYRNARTAIRALSINHGTPTDTVAALVSILSPSVRWERNLEDVQTLLAGFNAGESIAWVKVSTYDQNKRKAWRMLADKLPPQDMFPKRAMKTNAFYRCLKGPDTTHVVVDGHATAIALNDRKPLRQIPDISGKPYTSLSNAYRKAAELASVPVCTMQATTWIVWRNRYL